MSPKRLLFFLFPLILLGAETGKDPAWRQDFPVPAKGSEIPQDWELKKKFGTAAADFRVIPGEKGNGILKMTADKATASVITNPGEIDLTKTPILRWRWRVIKLPKGGDGRKSASDDQAIGIYVGSGSMFSKKSVSYRWDTLTPKGAEGSCAYGGGTIKIKWFTLRNESDGLSQWHTETRNVAEDFKAAWGYIPKDIYLSISCNSQYTGSQAEAELDWIEFLAAEKTVESPGS